MTLKDFDCVNDEVCLKCSEKDKQIKVLRAQLDAFMHSGISDGLYECPVPGCESYYIKEGNAYCSKCCRSVCVDHRGEDDERCVRCNNEYNATSILTKIKRRFPLTLDIILALDEILWKDYSCAGSTDEEALIALFSALSNLYKKLTE